MVKTALITGCSGYLGSHLSKELHREGWNVHGIDIVRPEYNEKYLTSFTNLNITEYRNYVNFNPESIDVVFHLAGRIEVGEGQKHPIQFLDNNVKGTINVLKFCEQYGIKNIVYSSSAAVYKSKIVSLKESDKLEPNSVYGQTKLMSEKMIGMSGINHINFRYFNLGGADIENEMGECHQPETHLIPRILQNLNNFTVYGNNYKTPDGTCIRDYIHVSDVARAHVLAANHLLTHNKSFNLNLGTNEGYSVLEIIKIIESEIGVHVNYSYGENRIGDPPILVADSSLAKKILNFETRYDIFDIIRTSNEWNKKMKVKSNNKK